MFVKIYSNCLPVKGVYRGLICDLQRNLYILVPLTLLNLFDTDLKFDLEEIKLKLEKSSLEILNEYLVLLEKHELIFYCSKSEAKRFPPLNLEWDYPGEISNFLIDLNKESTHDFFEIIKNQLNDINCRHIQIRCFCAKTMLFWESIIDIVNKSEVKSIDLVIPYNKDNFTQDDEITDWVIKNKKIRCLTLYGCGENQVLRQPVLGFNLIIKIKEQIRDIISCGVIHPSYFSINIETFTESQHHNTCLNRKIAIDAEGNIKNCPSMAKSYGNIKDTKLIEVVNNPEFQKVWHIKKDEITKCKDCEFRHICTDCRAYIDNPEDQYSAPLKCGYNPYTCEWDEWSTNPLKQKAIEYYGMQELVKK